jgi:LacI family transcriptional regulator
MPVTLKQIAKEVGVSHQAVSYALNGNTARVSDATRRRIERAAEKLGYRPNTAARMMRTTETGQVGVLIRNSRGNRFTHPLAYETILGINEGLLAKGKLAVLVRIDDVEADLADQSRVFKEHALDGMIVLDRMTPRIEQSLEDLIDHVVWCDSSVWRPHNCIRRDELAAGRLAGQAAARAYGDIVMVSYPGQDRPHFSLGQRIDGVRDAVELAGKPFDTVVEPVTDAERDAFAQRLKPRTAVICNSVYQAHVVRDIASEAGVIPGRDFGLACCDDQHQLDRLWRRLSRVSFPRYGMGLQAADMLVALTEGDGPQRSVCLDPDFIAGATLAPARP